MKKKQSAKCFFLLLFRAGPFFFFILPSFYHSIMLWSVTFLFAKAQQIILSVMILMPRPQRFQSSATADEKLNILDSNIHVYTYIIVHYSPSVRIAIIHLTPFMLYVLILYIRSGTCSLKSTPNNLFFEKLFMSILFSLRIFVRSLLRRSHWRNIFFRFHFIGNLKSLGFEEWPKV